MAFVSDRQRRACFARLFGSNRFSSKPVVDFKEAMFEAVPWVVDDVITEDELNVFDNRGFVPDSLSSKVANELIVGHNIPVEVVLKEVDGIPSDANLKREIAFVIDREKSLAMEDVISFESPVKREQIFEAVEKAVDKVGFVPNSPSFIKEVSSNADLSNYGEELRYLIGEAYDYYLVGEER